MLSSMNLNQLLMQHGIQMVINSALAQLQEMFLLEFLMKIWTVSGFLNQLVVEKLNCTVIQLLASDSTPRVAVFVRQALLMGNAKLLHAIKRKLMLPILKVHLDLLIHLERLFWLYLLMAGLISWHSLLIQKHLSMLHMIQSWILPMLRNHLLLMRIQINKFFIIMDAHYFKVFSLTQTHLLDAVSIKYLFFSRKTIKLGRSLDSLTMVSRH